MPTGTLVTVPVPTTVVVSSLAKLKYACACLAVSMVTVQTVPVPLQAPPQPTKLEPPVAVAVSVTVLFAAKIPEHVPLGLGGLLSGSSTPLTQLIPVGLLVTVPLPLPCFTTTRVWFGTKVAVTLLAALIVTVQRSVPVQEPVQPVNTKPDPATAVSVTVVPWSKSASQAEPQLMPAGLLVTVLVVAPEPFFATARFTCCAGSKKAVAYWALLITSVQVSPVELAQSSAQPINAIPASGVAVSVTEVFAG